MALVESLDLPLGSPIPEFRLPDPQGRIYESGALFGPKGLLVAFTCNHCPYAIAVWPRLIALAKEAQALGVQTVGINPNIHPNYPDDAPPRMQDKIREWGIPFPYLVDAMQSVARAFEAQCTPDLYLYDGERRLVYHGRLDDNWQSPEKVTHRELWMAIEAMVNGQPVLTEQKPSMGCSIKWQG